MYNEITIAAKWWKDHFMKYDEQTATNNNNNNSNNSTNNSNYNTPNASATPNKNWRSQLPPSSNAALPVSTPVKKKNDLLTIFEDEFIKELTRRYQGHWYEDDPLRGSAYRAITYDHRLDSLFMKIGQQLDMNQHKMEQALISARFSVMFINPGQVKVANLALTNTPPISLYEADSNGSNYYDLPSTSTVTSASAWSPFSAVNNKSFLSSPSKDPNEEKTNDENKNYSNSNNNNTSDMKRKSQASLTSAAVNNSRWASAVSSNNGNNNNNRLSNNGNKSSPYLATFSPTAPLSPASPTNLSMNLNNHQNLDGMSADVLAIS